MQRGMVLAVVAAALGIPPAGAAAPATAPEPPKVVYSRVEGKDCLQPTIRCADATAMDYQEAELRWLNATYPGAGVPEFESIFTLVPPSAADPEGMRRVVHLSDTAHVKAARDQTVQVCFDVNLTELQPLRPEPDEEPEVY